MAEQLRITCRHCQRRMARDRFPLTGTGHHRRICSTCAEQAQRDTAQVSINNAFNLWFHTAGTGQPRPMP